MTTSPYSNEPQSRWREITENLIENYPLTTQQILDLAMLSWRRLWNFQIGGKISLEEVELPATIVGYFFQKLFAHELKSRYPKIWKGEELKTDKDLVNIQNSNFSTEMKCSGQLGYSLFGNRSYNQVSESSDMSGKNKSGYYITVNFYKKVITLLRIGWIDQDDWVPQSSATGQAAVLKPEVYQHKLIEINGPYRKESPIELLDGIGPKSVLQFHGEGVFTFGNLKSYSGDNPKIIKTKNDNHQFLNSF